MKATSSNCRFGTLRARNDSARSLPATIEVSVLTRDETHHFGFSGAQGIIIVYDVTDRETFDNVRTWINEIDKYSTAGVCKILVGNKCDKESQRQVTKEEGQEFANQFNMPFLETSAKATLNVEEAFL